MDDIRTKERRQQFIILALSGFTGFISLALLQIFSDFISIHNINLLSLAINVNNIFFLYKLLDLIESYIRLLKPEQKLQYFMQALRRQIGWTDVKQNFQSLSPAIRFPLMPVVWILKLVFSFFTSTYILEFAKLVAALFSAGVINFYAIMRPIFNQNYDPNYTLIILGLAIPAAALARIIFELRQAREMALQSRVAQAEAQYNLLETQMQPHFLFNSLNVLSELIYVNPDLACSVTQQLADLYREILTNSKQNFSNLGSEISILRKYIQIQKVRFGDRITFHTHVDSDLYNIAVPSLILQTLVENAIKHGISPRQEGGEIDLTVVPQGDMYEITISNTGELYKGPKKADLGTGLQNTKNRLDLFYGHSHDFRIYSEENKTYVRFKVKPESTLENI